MEKLARHLESLRSSDPKLEVSRSEDGAGVELLRGKLAPPVAVEQLERAPESTARQYLHANEVLLGGVPLSSLEHVRVNVSPRGARHVIFQQRFGDAEVLGGQVSVHYAADGSVYMLQSHLARNIDAPQTPSIGEERATAIAVENAGDGYALYGGTRPALVVAPVSLLHASNGRRSYILCWRLDVAGPGGPRGEDWTYFIDAADGTIVNRQPMARTGTGTGIYSTGSALNSEASGGTFRLRDTVTSAGWPVATKPAASTYDDAGSTSTTLTTYSTDANNIWDNVATPPTPRRDNQGPEVDIQRFVGYVLDYYQDEFGWTGWDGAGLSIIAHAHNENLPNNAYWHSGTHQIYFADGNGTTRGFMCPLDTVTHEFSHGVKHFLNILQTYSGETGALDEATNDVLGAFVTLLHPADDPWPWIHGRQYRLDGSIGRNMADPSRDANGVVHYDTTSETAKYNSTLNGWFPDHFSIRYLGSQDNYGVHANAPIVSHALYLMCQGGTHRLSNVKVTGIGTHPIEQILWETLSSGVLTNASTFADFRLHFIAACQELYPDNVDYLAAVKSAFDAVGIGPDLYCRDTLADQGDEPGILSSWSPDIVVRRAPADAALLAQIANAGNGSLGEDMALTNTDHHAYFRIFNRGSVAAAGTFRLFLSPVSSFPTPSTWHEVGHYDFPAVPPDGGMWVPTSAAQGITIPSALITSLGAGHYCFIGIVECAEDPAPDRTGIDDVNEFHEFISGSNNYAWRNCNITTVTPDADGAFAAITGRFRINGFGLRQVARYLEVDLRDVPRTAQVAIWLPAERIVGLKAADAAVESHRPAKVADVLDATAITGTRYFALADLLRPREREDPPDDVDPHELPRWRRLELPAGRVTRLEGLAPRGGRPVDVRLVVRFAPHTGTRDVTITFREATPRGRLGEMNFVYRVRAPRMGRIPAGGPRTGAIPSVEEERVSVPV